MSHEIIKFSVENSLIFSMKHTSICELTGKYYEDDIHSFRLLGSEYINPHHCYGSIFYHLSNKHLCEDANIYFECTKQLLTSHSLQGTEVRIQRSNGDFNTIMIEQDNPIFYCSERDVLAINIRLKDNLTKIVSLTDYYSSRSKSMVSGLFSINPALNKEPLQIIVKKGSGIFEIDQCIWENKMSTYLTSANIDHKFIRQFPLKSN